MLYLTSLFFEVEIYNVSSAWQSGKWFFAEAANSLGAWVGITPAWGSAELTPANGSDGTSFKLLPTDAHVAMVFFAGDEATFGTKENFTSSLLAAAPTVSASRVVRFRGPGQEEILFPWTNQTGGIRLPMVGGQVQDDTPRMAYDGPYMKGLLGDPLVRTDAKRLGLNWSLDYDFTVKIV